MDDPNKIKGKKGWENLYFLLLSNFSYCPHLFLIFSFNQLDLKFEKEVKYNFLFFNQNKKFETLPFSFGRTKSLKKSQVLYAENTLNASMHFYF